MFQIPTLYTNYQELLLDIDIYGNIVSSPILSKDELKNLLFEEYKITHPLPTLEDKRYELSSLVSSDYHISYSNELELASNESLVDLGVGCSSSDDFDFDDNIIVPSIFKEKFEYGSVTDRVREELIKNFINDTEELSDEDSKSVEKLYATVEEDNSLVYEDSEDSDYDCSELSTAFDDCDLDLFISSKNYEDDSDFGEYSDDEDSREDDEKYSDDEDLREDEEEYSSYDDDEVEDDYSSDVNSDSDEDSYDEDDDYSSDEDSYDEDDDYSSDEDSYDEDDDYSSDEDSYDEDELSDEGDSDDDYSSDDEDLDEYYSDEDDESNDSDEYQSDDDSDEYQSDDLDDDLYDEDDYSSYDNDDSDDEDEDDYASDNDEDLDEYYSDEDDESDGDDDSDEYSSDDDSDDEDEYGSYNEDDYSSYDNDDSDDEDETSDSDIDSSMIEDEDESIKNIDDIVSNEVMKDTNNQIDVSVPTPIEIINSNKEKENVNSNNLVVDEPKVNRDEEPKDLRDFVRKHPRCEVSFALKYFSRKEIEKYIMMGKIIKKGSKLHI